MVMVTGKMPLTIKVVPPKVDYKLLLRIELVDLRLKEVRSNAT